MHRIPQLWDESWLRREYVSKRRSTAAIAMRLGCSPSAVTAALRRYGIKARGARLTTRKLHDRAWLHDAYIGERRSLADMAALLGCSAPTVATALRRQGIPVRPRRDRTT